MKKWTKVLLGILMIVPMLVGMIFALPNLDQKQTPTTLNGGGGGQTP